MPALYMLVGLPGSGKSTFAKNLFGFNYSTDSVVESIANLQGKTYNEVFFDWIKVAQNQMDENLEVAIQHKDDVIWDQTNLTAKSRKSKLSKIPKDYRKVAFVFIADQVVLEKVNNERKEIGRDIPEKVLLDMQKNFEYPTKDEGFDEIYFICGQ